VAALAFLPDGQALISGSHDGSVRLWTLADKKSRPLPRQQGPVRCLALSSDGRVLAIGGDKAVRLWDMKANKDLASLRPATNAPATGVATAPDGRKLAVAASRSPLVSLWDIAASSQHVLLRGHADKVHALAFSPDGQMLVTGSEDQT